MQSISTVNILCPDENIPGWCEETVEGVAFSMETLANCAKILKARIVLLGTIQSLKIRCLKCCASGQFWKKCVAPIAEKWQKWNN